MLHGRVQKSVHVVTVLTDGVFNTGDVQPADYHTEELQRDKEDRMMDWQLLLSFPTKDSVQRSAQ